MAHNPSSFHQGAHPHYHRPNMRQPPGHPVSFPAGPPPPPAAQPPPMFASPASLQQGHQRPEFSRFPGSQHFLPRSTLPPFQQPPPPVVADQPPLPQSVPPPPPSAVAGPPSAVQYPKPQTTAHFQQKFENLAQDTSVPPPPRIGHDSSNLSLAVSDESAQPRTGSFTTNKCQVSQASQSHQIEIGLSSPLISDKNHQNLLPPIDNAARQTSIRDSCQPIRTGLAGVKRKGLANELMGGSATSHHINWTRLWDVNMSDELMAKCKPLYCELCRCPFSSPVQAKMHYEGKIHDKHVRGFYTKLGVSPANLPLKMDSSGKFPRQSVFKCEICHMDFISEPVYTQHVMGKNHKRMASKQFEIKPTFFNKETKRFEKTPVLEPDTKAAPAPDPANAFFCHVCKVGAPSQEQLDVHLNGKNHKKKMARSMGGLESTDVTNINKRMKFKETIMSTMTGGNKIAPPSMGMRRGGIFGRRGEVLGGGGKDYSIYRTPSGSYYCSSCNVTATNVAQFEQHSTSKKHKQKDGLKKARC